MFLQGNRLLVSLWTATPHNNPPLDLSEIESQLKNKESQAAQFQQAEIEYKALHAQSQEYMELREKRESEI